MLYLYFVLSICSRGCVAPGAIMLQLSSSRTTYVQRTLQSSHISILHHKTNLRTPHTWLGSSVRRFLLKWAREGKTLYLERLEKDVFMLLLLYTENIWWNEIRQYLEEEEKVEEILFNPSISCRREREPHGCWSMQQHQSPQVPSPNTVEKDHFFKPKLEFCVIRTLSK